jgi:hypothetical protein
MSSPTDWMTTAAPFADVDRLIVGYEIIREIARGGNGRVYEVRAPGGVSKAVKIIRFDADDPLTAREAEGLRLIRGVRHPYLISIDRVDVERDQITLVMELADCSLREMQAEFLADGGAGIPPDKLMRRLVEAAEALDVLNIKYRIHHLDVKPENLFLVADHLKVGDYGLAREAGRSVVDPETNAVTPAYAAPELFDSHVHPTSDQYSLAVVYMEMLTGSLPFRTTNLRQLALYHLTRQPNLTALPPAQRSVVGKALARDPEKRYHSCLEFMEALAEAASARNLARPQADVDAVRAAGAAVRGRAPTRSSVGPSFSMTALPQGATVSRRRCFVTDGSSDDVRAAVKRLADASLAEWFDFGETLVAYRRRDAFGSIFVGVRVFSRAPHSPVSLEATATRNGGCNPATFDRQADAIFADLQESLSARPDDEFGRGEPRVQGEWPATLFPVDGPLGGTPIPCTVVNASSKGLGAVSSIPIDAAMVYVRLAGESEMFPARAVYCRASSNGTSFLVGMEFAEPIATPWLGASTAAAPNAPGA